MINQETKLKLQAYLDNELAGAQTRCVAARLEDDAEARKVYTELRDVKTALAGNELEMSVPETREFYWSKIERAITHPSASREARPFLTGYPWWVRLFAPALGVAVLLVAVLSLVKQTSAPATVTYLHEIDTPLEETSSISFHSQTAGMTVVWVQTQ
jgi:hypothetical protein